MNAKISVFVICVKAIIYLLLHNLHDCNAKLIFEKLHLTRKLKFRILTPWQLFSIVHSTCYPIFGSFTTFNSTFFENLKTISLLNLLI